MAGFNIVAGSVFQALGHGVLSLAISLVRQLVVLLPAAYILSRLFPLEAVWLSFPIMELLRFILAVFFVSRTYTSKLAVLRPQAA